MTTETVATNGDPAGHVAAEIRAELARRRMSLRQFALMLGVNQLWVNRRVSTMQTEMSLDDIVLMANGLELPVWRLLPRTWLPRLDSNQQPAGSAGRRSGATIALLPAVRGSDERVAPTGDKTQRPALRLVR